MQHIIKIQFDLQEDYNPKGYAETVEKVLPILLSFRGLIGLSAYQSPDGVEKESRLICLKWEGLTYWLMFRQSPKWNEMVNEFSQYATNLKVEEFIPSSYVPINLEGYFHNRNKEVPEFIHNPENDDLKD